MGDVRKRCTRTDGRTDGQTYELGGTGILVSAPTAGAVPVSKNCFDRRFQNCEIWRVKKNQVNRFTESRDMGRFRKRYRQDRQIDGHAYVFPILCPLFSMSTSLDFDLDLI